LLGKPGSVDFGVPRLTFLLIMNSILRHVATLILVLCQLACANRSNDLHNGFLDSKWPEIRDSANLIRCAEVKSDFLSGPHFSEELIVDRAENGLRGTALQTILDELNSSLIKSNEAPKFSGHDSRFLISYSNKYVLMSFLNKSNLVNFTDVELRNGKWFIDHSRSYYCSDQNGRILHHLKRNSGSQR
jgi:hypothetical protein